MEMTTSLLLTTIQGCPSFDVSHPIPPAPQSSQLWSSCLESTAYHTNCSLQWTAVRLRRIQDICSRLWIQTCHKLTQIPQSNGFVERMVQTVKKIVLKVRQSSTDPDLSLLCLRTTPIDNNLPSSAKLLYSWQLRSSLPLLSSHTPQDTAVHKNLQARQWMQKNYHNRSVRDLLPLHTGQHVHLPETNGTWIPATVVEKRPELHSCTVHTPNGGLYRRNRHQLQDLTAPPKHITWADQASPDINLTSSPDQQQQINMPVTTTAPPPKADSFTPNGQTSDKPVPAQTPLRCSSRHTKPSQWLIENM